MKTLILDDDELALLTAKHFLNQLGVKSCSTVQTIYDFEKKLHDEQFELILIDLDLERELEGLNAIDIVKRMTLNDGIFRYIAVLSSRYEENILVEAYKVGCHDYLCKPMQKENIKFVLERALIYSQIKEFDIFFEERFHTRNANLRQQIESIALNRNHNFPIFISGESGTGKTFLARKIHEHLFHNQGPFIALNCSEFSEELLASELFGHRKGAFSGSTNDYDGKIMAANGGTLFLDEIGTMGQRLQQMLLKVIEEKEFYPVGSNEKRNVQFRLISASCENIDEKIIQGNFRADLFYRINGHQIHILPLRERKEDIKLFLKKSLLSSPRKILFDDLASKKFIEYSWPGNVRELQRDLQQIISSSDGVVSIYDLPEKMIMSNNKNDGSFSIDIPRSIMNESKEILSSLGDDSINIPDLFDKAMWKTIKNIQEEKKISIRNLSKKYGVSSKLFYRLKKQFDKS